MHLEIFLLQLHAGEGVLVVRVEARGDDDEVRGEEGHLVDDLRPLDVELLDRGGAGA